MKELDVNQLRVTCDVKEFECKTSAELPPLNKIVGQQRALSAVQFGLEIQNKGFNIYVAGSPGTGRTTAVKAFLEERAAKEPVPSDWCYVSNFVNQYQPQALELPPGKGKDLVIQVSGFVEAARTSISSMLESEEYAQQKEEKSQFFEQQRNALSEQMQVKAQEAGFMLRGAQTGLIMVPVIDGKPLSPEDAAQLPVEARREIETRRMALDKDLRSLFRQLRDIERELRKELRKMETDSIQFTLDPLLSEFDDDYKDNPNVVKWINAMAKDITEHLNEFLGRVPHNVPPEMLARRPSPEDFAQRYQVNCIVDNSEREGAPVVILLNPTYANLFGRIEKEPRFGSLVTDFSMIRSGAMHEANGGYLVIPTLELLTAPLSYPALKRALQNDKIAIEEASEMVGLLTVKSLHPEPIPFKLKVITIGEGSWYHQLYQGDPDFRELFKVKADFDTSMERSPESVQVYGSFICSLHYKEDLRPLVVDAIAAIVDYSSRLADHQGKLSTRFDIVADVIREANFYAQQDNKEFVLRKHIKQALDERVYRSNLYAEKTREMIEKEYILISTSGDAIGQINGLSVLSLGDFSFGRPSRVTASVAPGRGRVLDIERESNLGGPTHTKGVLILNGYLAEKFSDDKPLSLSARLVFEQSYGGIDGDSASSTELYAILSALSEVPIQQRFAVTGSVNQHGEVQAIGGVNQKIEGYFDVCNAQGLTGDQSVMIPKSNVQNLMLKDEVVDAVREGKFHIYPIGSIDEGIEVLTGIPAGERQPDGSFPEGTIHYKVDQRLTQMASTMREYGNPSSS